MKNELKFRLKAIWLKVLGLNFGIDIINPIKGLIGELICIET
jgi:hypothetical protein